MRLIEIIKNMNPIAIAMDIFKRQAEETRNTVRRKGSKAISKTILSKTTSANNLRYFRH